MTDFKDLYIVDANVLIDYLNSDISILTIYSKEIGQIYVPTDVLDRVKKMNTGDCNRLDLKIVEPTLEQYLEAANKIGGLAFDDRVCFILARDNNWHCITNDKQLRVICEGKGISVLWGLEIMIPLLERRLIQPLDILQVAKDIHESNPYYVTHTILKKFETKVSKITKKKKS